MSNKTWVKTQLVKKTFYEDYTNRKFYWTYCRNNFKKSNIKYKLKKKNERRVKTKFIFMSIYPIHKNSKISMNN